MPDFPDVPFIPIPDRDGCVALRPGKGLITPADGLMETGEPGRIVPHPPGRKTMFKKIALCAMLVLLLAPAAVMAAGQQGQGPCTGNEAGTCLQVQQRGSGDTTGQGQFQNGNARMLQNRSCDEDCDQSQAMVRNMTRNQNRLNADPLQQQNGVSEPLQKRFGMSKGKGQMTQAGFTDQLRTPIRNAAGMCRMLQPEPEVTTTTT